MKPIALQKLIVLLCLSFSCFGQKESYNWYFGNQAGLSFSSSPVTVLTNGMLNSYESCSSISDINGNLLFYTDGITVWNRLHLTMANGNLLLGDSSSSQSGLIVKQPGNSSQYYIFSLDDWAGVDGLRYSVVNMSLAAGNGSVTSKNVAVYTPSTEKITAARHCNGTDVWIITHEWNNDNFRAYLLTSSGLSTSPVISSVGPVHNGQIYTTVGCLKASPSSKKLGMATYWNSIGIELYDFDNTTGTVSNPLQLSSDNFAYGAEFSPDGSKFYGAFTDAGNQLILQWDLCAGNNSAILASEYTVGSIYCGQMQRAPNGKIYVSTYGQSSLSVINNPNAAGASCGFAAFSQPLGGATSKSGLPQLAFSRTPPPPFTYTASCGQAGFTSPPAASSVSSCAMSTFTLMNLNWNFGDPNSGASNTSTLSNPSHTFTGPGPFSVQLVFNYSCGGGSDTLRQVVQLPGASAIAIAGKTNICHGGSTTLTASGASSYSWSTGSTNTSIVVSPPNTTTYTLSATSGSCTYAKTITVTVKECTGLPGFAQDHLLRYYPNPVNDVLSFESEFGFRLRIVDLSGRCLVDTPVSAGTNNISTSQFPIGVYLLHIQTETGQYSSRLLKTSD